MVVGILFIEAFIYIFSYGKNSTCEITFAQAGDPPSLSFTRVLRTRDALLEYRKLREAGALTAEEINEAIKAKKSAEALVEATRFLPRS